jgi:uncharacterized OB-fold protein
MKVPGPHGAGIPVPLSSAVTEPFWTACRRGDLTYQRCQSCGSAVFVPTGACRYCGSTLLRWDRSEGRGRIYSFSTVWRPQMPAFEVPYVVAIVDLDEGFQMIANIIGCDVELIEIDMVVAVEFHPTDSVVLPYFSPV